MKLFYCLIVLFSAVLVVAKDKPTIVVHVLNTDHDTRAYSQNGTLVQVTRETITAQMPDGHGVTLWCEKRLRTCIALSAGDYKAEVDGPSTLWIQVPQLDGTVKRVKYRLQ
jgi:hypothetical protein